MSAEAFVFWLGLLLISGGFLYIIGRGPRKVASGTDPYAAALNYILNDDWDGALDSLRRAAHAGSTSADVYIKLGSVLRRRGNHATALQIHQTLTVRQDLTPEERTLVQRCLVEDYRALGRRREALAALQQLAQDGRDGPLQREIAQEALLCGDYVTAERAIRALRGDGTQERAELARFLAAMGERCRQQEQRAEAKRYFQEALKENGNCEPALLALGDLVHEEGDLESALYYWQKLAFATSDVEPELYDRLERVYFDLGKFSDIEGIYAQILERRPRDQQALLAAGKLATKKGQVEEAERLLRAALEQAPDSPRAFQLLAHLLLEQGKTQEARQLIDTHVGLLQAAGRRGA
ncbi:MAG TPA: tetratricopeptide repeat protein [Candidatus Krumholzibacteria bacterium]|nr:tetratricopeptide repeat protein [Candidatus Krumholzibacteria bacterium]